MLRFSDADEVDAGARRDAGARCVDLLNRIFGCAGQVSLGLPVCKCPATSTERIHARQQQRPRYRGLGALHCQIAALGHTACGMASHRGAVSRLVCVGTGRPGCASRRSHGTLLDLAGARCRRSGDPASSFHFLPCGRGGDPRRRVPRRRARRCAQRLGVPSGSSRVSGWPPTPAPRRRPR